MDGSVGGGTPGSRLSNMRTHPINQELMYLCTRLRDVVRLARSGGAEDEGYVRIVVEMSSSRDSTTTSDTYLAVK